MIIISLAGCSNLPLPKSIEVSTKPIEKPTLTLPPVDELSLRPIEWIVVTEKNYEEVKKTLESQGKPLALYSLTGKGYENLGLNFSDIRALVQQQQAIILAYENYYLQAEEAMEDAVVEN